MTGAEPARTQAARRDRARAVARVLWVVLGLNLLVCGGKAAVGLATGSLALLADSVHSLLDASSNVVGLVGVAVASRPPDAGHPYGHRRFEALAALGIGLLIGGGLVEIVRSLIRGVVEGVEPPRVDPWSVAFVALTVVVNLAISTLEARRGRALSSALLLADAAHTRSDVAGSAVVLASFVGVWLGIPGVDLVAAAVVAAIVARAAVGVMGENLRVLTDHAQLDPLEVHRVAMGVPGVKAAHHIRSRGMPGDVELDLRIHVDPAMPLREAHALSHRVSDALCAAFPQLLDVVIHPEPAEPEPGASVAPGLDAPGVGGSA